MDLKPKLTRQIRKTSAKTRKVFKNLTAQLPTDQLQPVKLWLGHWWFQSKKWWDRYGRQRLRADSTAGLVLRTGVVMLVSLGVFYAAATAATGSDTLRPDGDQTAGWLCTESTAGDCTTGHYAVIDESTLDSTDYVSLGTNGGGGEEEEWTFTNPSETTITDVSEVSATFNSHSSGGCQSDCDTLSVRLFIDGAYDGTTQTITMSGTQTNRTVTWTGSWTTADDIRIEVVRNVVGGGNPDGRDDNVTIYQAYADVTYTFTAATIQDHFRWRNDDGTESGASWKAGEDSNAIGDVPKGETIRLRFEITRAGTNESAARNYRLEWAAKSGGTCGDDESWIRVDTASDDFAMVDSANLTDGNATTDQLDTGSGTHVAGEVADTTDETGAIGPLNAGEDTEVEYSLQPTNNAGNDNTYCFRMSDAGTALDTYNVFPELSTPPPSPMELVQESYIFENDDGADVNSNTPQTSSPNTAISNLKKGERLTARFHIKNTSGAPGKKANFGLFYDRGDGIFTKVKKGHPSETGTGDCDSDTNFDCTSIDMSGTVVGQHTSIAFDSNGNPWVSYYDNANGSLEVARYVGSGGNCSDAAWQCSTVDSTDDVGRHSSIAISSNGTAWISYYNTTNNDLEVARYVGSGGDCDNTAWECYTVDTVNGLETSIALDASGNPWVSYRVTSMNRLKVAQFTGSGGDCSDTAWSCSVVDDNGTLGHDSSIAFDPAGQAWVSYQDNTAGDLKVAHYVGSGGNCTDSAWECNIVDTANGHTSMAFDPAGNPWVSLQDGGNLKVVHRVGGSGGNCTNTSWQCATVDATDSVGADTSLAFDAAGQAWVSHQDTTNGNLEVARYVGSGGNCDTVGGGSDGWQCTTVDATDDVGSSTSLAFDAAGQAWVSYHDSTNGNLEVAKTNRAGEITISPGAAGSSGDALTASEADDAAGGTDCASASTFVNGKWFEAEEGSGATLDDGQCTEVAFTLDTSQAQVGQTYRLVLATDDNWRQDKGPWRGPVSVDNYATITTGPGGSQIARYAKDALAKFADCADASFGCTTVDATDDVGDHTSLAFDAAGQPWVSYHDGTNANLEVTNYVGSGGNCDDSGGSDAWQCTTVDATDSVGQHTSLAFDSAGNPWVSYYDSTNGNLKVTNYVGSGGNCSDTAWNCITVDSSASVGQYTSLALDPNGNPWVSYYDSTNDNLEVARYVGSGGNCDDSGGSDAWQCTTVDATDSVGQHTSLAFDSAGQAWVSHRDSTNANLEVARYVGSGGNCDTVGGGSDGWQCTTVDATDDVGQYTSLAFDASGQAWVSYFDNTNNSLEVAQYVGSGGNCDDSGGSDAWQCTTVDATDSVGLDTSIAFDAAGQPWASYWDSTNDNLEVAQYVGSGGNCDDSGGSDAWQCTTVDATGTSSFGTYSSIAFDPSGNPWISYHYYTLSSNLGVAKLHLPLTQLSAADQIPYDTRSAGSGDARLRLDAGQSPRGEASCSATAAMMGYCGVSQVDGNYDSITTNASERPMYTFAQKFESNSNLPTITWHGQSSVAPGSAGTTGDIVLQAYRFGATNGWETIQTDTASSDCSTANCVITAQPAGTPGEYFEAEGSDYWTYFRIWQYEDTAGITFKTDSLRAAQNRQFLRHGRFFQAQDNQPFFWPGQ